jgi:hypothetical protein
MIVQGRAAAEPTIRRAVAAFLGDQVSGEERLQWGILAQMATMGVWDFDSWVVLSTRDVEFARASGALAPLSIALNGRGMVATQCGDFETATSLALVSEGQEAEQSYAEAVERLGRTPLRPELARAHLLYGEWLRRENRRPDARHRLHAAYHLFTVIGADAFAERARSELLATGEKVRKMEDRRRPSCPRHPPPPKAPAPFPGRRTCQATACPATFVRAMPRSATCDCITSRPARGR